LFQALGIVWAVAAIQMLSSGKDILKKTQQKKSIVWSTTLPLIFPINHIYACAAVHSPLSAQSLLLLTGWSGGDKRQFSKAEEKNWY